MLTPYDTRLPPHLAALKAEIEGYARGYGLDFFETIFEVIDADDLNEIAAYGGFPTRYPHWSFGMQYEELRKGYDYGLSKIYEMVINNDPCYAYLMRSNPDVDQKLVMSHVYGHCLAPETEIETEDGFKPITEIRVGDRVLTHTGQLKRVRAIGRRWFSGDIFLIRVDGCTGAVRITGEHPVGVMTEHYELTWVPAGKLGGGLHVGLPRVAPIPTGASIALLSDGRYMDMEEPHDIYDDHYEWRSIGKPKTEQYEGYVYNFSVEDDESYTIADRFVVHNCDFFKNNAYFAHTNRKMMDEMANHGSRIRHYTEKYGEDEVEAFLDRCMSIDDLIDIHSTAIRRRDPVSRSALAAQGEETSGIKATRFKSKDYMDEHINPRKVLQAEEEEQRKIIEEHARNFPEHPEKDVLLFLLEHAPLKSWQHDVLEIVRDEAYYFMPQGQTKVANEGWACAVWGSFVYTDRGLMRLGEVVENRLPVRISDGRDFRQVCDWASFSNRETVRIRTRRGLELEGSKTHRVMLPDGDWRRLDEVGLGDRVRIACGNQLWATEYVPLNWQPQARTTLTDVAEAAEVSLWTVLRYRAGRNVNSADRLAPLVSAYDQEVATTATLCRNHNEVSIPTSVDERFASFLGYMIGDGHISAVKRSMGLTTGDDEQADHFAELVEELFGILPRRKRDGGRWRVLFSSKTVQLFLQHLGLKTGISARIKTIPDVILCSPKPVVASFLRAYYDCDGYAGKSGVILSTASEAMSKQVQLLLLNFGVLSSRRPQQDGCWHVASAGKAARVFLKEIGFGLARKQEALRNYVEDRQWFKEQPEDDEIVSIEHGRADVYDITVEETHRYAAQGFINHNSYWHTTIMTQKAMLPSEVLDFAEHHSGTVAMSGARINPYKLGLELLRDIEMRWNTGRFGKEWEECDDLEAKRKWDKQLGLGRQKIFEVRKIHNDITFIDTFLTPEFCVEHKMFTYAWQEQAGVWYIDSRDFQKVKQRLLFSLTNFGKPWIYVVDGNYRNRGELLLMHQFNGVELRMDHAADTLANLQFIWGRPVHLQTLVDNKPTMLSFDGTDHSIKTGGEIDDAGKKAAAKTR